MTKSEQLRTLLEELDASLISASSQTGVSPIAPKIDEGDDRWGGYP
jgi:hypothetical protein